MIRLGLTEDFYDRPVRESRALSAREEVFAEWAALNGSSAGVTVTQQTATSLSAYWNGICVIAGDIGALDRHIYRRVGEDDRERATSLPAYRLVHDKPNDDTTGMVFWETLTSHAVGWGNGYAEIEFDRAGRPIGLWLITPDLIEPKVEVINDSRRGRITRVYYLYRGTKRLESWEVFHVPGLGFDGVRGYSPVRLARQSMGLSIAMERFGASYFGNGAWAGVALMHPKTLGETAIRNLRESFEERHQGSGNAFKPIILEDGMTVSKPITIPPDDAQFLESRSFQIEEIARWLNISPYKLKHKMGEWPGGTPESLEIDHQTTTLLPWTTRIEQECDRKLITGNSGAYYTEHNFQKRLKADTATRMGSYQILTTIGAMDADEVARRENLPKPKPKPAPDPQPQPAPIETPPAQPAARALPAADVVAAQRALLNAEVTRFMRREAEQARRAAEKGPDGFSKWMDRYYGADEERILAGSLAPAVGLCMVSAGLEGDAGGVARGFARAYLERSRADLGDLSTKDLPGDVGDTLKRWESARAAQCVDAIIAAMAAEESVNVA